VIILNGLTIPITSLLSIPLATIAQSSALLLKIYPH
jgi:hypothetical protein